MISLTSEECRVLGVLVEKELTTPEQYPLSVNAAVNGANQKNNREPLTQYGEEQVLDALVGLREKGLVVRVDQAGARVPKYRQEMPAKLGLNRYQLVVVAELLLRGPQTVGEIRGRASRMHPLESMEVVQSVLDELSSRPEPLVRRLSGGRADRYAQLLCPDAHPLDAPAEAPAAAGSSSNSLADRVRKLEERIEQLSAALRKLATALGEADPLPSDSPAEQV